MPQIRAIRGRALPAIDHTLVLENIWVVVAIAAGGGGLMGEIVGFAHGNLGCGIKLGIMAGAAVIIFGAIWFFSPAGA